MDENKEKQQNKSNSIMQSVAVPSRQTNCSNRKKNKFKINIKNMGVDIDKNEYREIVLSHTNHPECYL